MKKSLKEKKAARARASRPAYDHKHTIYATTDGDLSNPEEVCLLIHEDLKDLNDGQEVAQYQLVQTGRVSIEVAAKIGPLK